MPKEACVLTEYIRYLDCYGTVKVAYSEYRIIWRQEVPVVSKHIMRRVLKIRLPTRMVCYIEDESK